jgi:DNA-directed RNA polymerase subunit RPC12/RpoP
MENKSNDSVLDLKNPKEDPQGLRNVSMSVKTDRSLFEQMPIMEQINVLLNFENSQEKLDLLRVLTTKAKVLLIYKMVYSKNYDLQMVNALSDESKLFHALGLLILHTSADSVEKDKVFSTFHNLIVEYFVEAINSGNLEYEDVADVLFPGCVMEEVKYCEAKTWQEHMAYCPRYKQGCTYNGKQRYNNRWNSPSGAKVYPDAFLELSKWSLQEFLSALSISPSSLGGELVKSDEYVNRMGGWINRTLELKERLRCQYCDTPFKSNLKYSMRLAVYNATRFTCIHHNENQTNHDQHIYISHCWSCKGVIDQREGGFQDDNGYYLCITCGSGDLGSTTFTQGNKCPQCGTEEMTKSDHHARGYECWKCTHTIILPQDYDLTGLAEDIQKRKMEIQQGKPHMNRAVAKHHFKSIRSALKGSPSLVADHDDLGNQLGQDPFKEDFKVRTPLIGNFSSQIEQGPEVISFDEDPFAEINKNNNVPSIEESLDKLTQNVGNPFAYSLKDKKEKINPHGNKIIIRLKRK